MSAIAEALEELMSLGVQGPALVAAIRRLEEATYGHVKTLEQAVEAATVKADEKLAEMRARSAERTRKSRAKKAGNVTVTLHDVSSRDGDGTQDARPTCASAQVVTLTSSLRSEGNPPVKPIGLTAPKGAETTRGSRLPDGFCPDLSAAEKAGLTLAQAAVEADKFLDYWRAVPGGRGRKSDWPATWRNWCRTAAERSPRKAHERPDPNPRQPSAREDSLRAHQSGAMAALNRRLGPLG